MAQRRCISPKVIDTDLFLDMPISTRLLYYDLCMRGDDDGFVSSPKKIMKIVGANEDDLKILIGKQFIIPFETGICVIKHWLIHNLIRKDRYNPTQYINEKSQLKLENDVYQFKNVIPNGNQMTPQVKLSQVNLIQDNSSKDNIVTTSNKDNLNIKDKYTNEVIYIVDYLNKKAGTNYKPNGTRTVQLIKARLNESYTPKDFIVVIDKKVQEWLGTDYAKYLRPETLFGNKFESYLNAPVKVKGNNAVNDVLRDVYDGTITIS